MSNSSRGGRVHFSRVSEEGYSDVFSTKRQNNKHFKISVFIHVCLLVLLLLWIRFESTSTLRLLICQVLEKIEVYVPH